MNKKPAVLFAVCLVLLTCLLSGCSGMVSAPIDRGQTIYGVSAGRYEAVGQDGALLSGLDICTHLTTDGAWVVDFTGEGFSYRGQLVLDGRAKVVCPEGTFVFDVVDNDTLRFLKEHSAAVPGDLLPADTLFKYVEADPSA